MSWVCWLRPSQTTRCATITDALLVTGVWYHVHLRYNTATPSLRITVKEVSGGALRGDVTDTNAITAYNCSGTCPGMLFGSITTGGSPSLRIDQIVVSDSPTRDIYTDFGSVTNYP